MKFYVYIVKCADGTFYTGITRNLEERVARHNRGHGARYTKGRIPVTLSYYEEYESIQSAMRREAHLRRIPRKKKEAIIHRFRTP
ncbi:MAG: GIY-YIG nuclease family protein [candidate division WOR-3 bacterium]|nr:MAG: GIY-YIG nuclease family protein [candidate division WOR-3 bacterium]